MTRYLPFELVDDVLEQTRTVQRRLREPPSRVGVYFVLEEDLPRPSACRLRLPVGAAGSLLQGVGKVVS